MKVLKKAVLLSLVLLILCGFIYPLLLTGISQVVFNKKANGSIIKIGEEAVGSELIGQDFTDSKFLKGRISSVNYNTYSSDTDYKGPSSGSGNLGASNKLLTKRVEDDIEKFLKENPTVKKEDIPTDLLTSSASGLDPNITVKSAEIQIPRISKVSGISEENLKRIVEKSTDKKLLGVFGEEKVNILKANIAIQSELNKK
ncbi:potassium-transporting ATPase subunit KdpC [Clostridium sp. CTA-19]